MDRSTTQLVKAFNSLQRTDSVLSLKGVKGANEWYFDVRYIHLEPNPYHVLYLMQMQPHAPVHHLEPLPAGLPPDRSGLAYFPETGREAALEVAKGIMYAFLHCMEDKEPIAPWKLNTPDKVLSQAVNEEFQRIGVHSSLKIVQSSFIVTCVANDTFNNRFNALKESMGYTGNDFSNLRTPDSICFPEIVEALPPLVMGKTHLDISTAYVRHIMEARPMNEILDPTSIVSQMTEEINQVQEMLRNIPEAVVRVQADSGDYEAAFDYGMRLRFGLGCTADRTLSRVYLIKALDLPLSSDEFKATVHAALIEWYVAARKEGVLKNRFLFAAAHHAKAAIEYSRRADPHRKYYSHHIMRFAKTLIEVNEKANTLGQIHTLYSDIVQLPEERDKQVEEEQKKLAQKRHKTPLRYRCATPGCGVQSDTGKMLQRCSGECDPDKKPSYCSRECQKADWKNHKPFCRPGAECSVVDDGIIDAPLQGGGTTSEGMIQIPVTYADGSTAYFSTSTLEPKVLKEMAKAMSTRGAPDGSSGAPRAWKFDIVNTELNLKSM